MPFPTFRLDDQVAIVTGSGSGIGRAVATALAEAGADVVITEVPDLIGRAKEVAGEIADGTGRQTHVVPLDVTQVASIQAMVDETLTRFGKIDVLVNNAGVNIRRRALEVSEEDWDGVLDVNLRGVFFCAQRVGRHMVRRRRGKIVNVASQNGVIGMEDRVAYCSSKAGVVNLTRVLALEWAEYGVNVNAIGPTFVRTPLTEPMWQDPAIYQGVVRRIPLGRLATPEDVVGAVVYLASPASDMVTGHTLLIDGGWTAG
ncbi:MAG: glucose 1-dehydrogenase [Chloroflexi bacterium]|nr:glucose 1-dehydrogenase [Chloroflexota bacterium]